MMLTAAIRDQEITTDEDRAPRLIILDCNPTVENMLGIVWDTLYSEIDKYNFPANYVYGPQSTGHSIIQLMKIKAWETATSFAEISMKNDC